jgi:putative glycerol-1-phosphate prenyltransferase
LDKSDCIAYARLAERLFEYPALYVEYSGQYGDPEKVAAMKKELMHTHLFYGGGISNEEQTKTMAKIADTVVVGNLLYRHVAQAVKTAGWVKEAKATQGKKG